MDSVTKTRDWYSFCASPDFFYVTMTGNWGCIDDIQQNNYWGGGNYGPAGNNWGQQLPKTGLGYIGFGVPSRSEMVRGKLTDSLIGGKRYAASYYASLGEAYYAQGALGMDLIGFWFTKDSLILTDPFVSCGQYFNDMTYDAGNQSGNFLTDTASWMLVQDTFIAQGGERYFVFGDVKPDSTQYFGSNTPTPCYYYFDDFDIHCIDCEDTASPPPPRPPAFQLFPNPNDGVFSISGPFAIDDRIVVYDAVGRLIFSYHVTAENNLLQLFPQLATGVYVCRVERGDEVLFKRRVVVAE
jgi:hypothetical protein